jgi:hypothetical protein
MEYTGEKEILNPWLLLAEFWLNAFALLLLEEF